MKKKLIIIGAWEQGRVAHNIASLMWVYDFQWFLDDNPQAHPKVIWNVQQYTDFSDEHVFYIAFWNNQLRKQLFETLRSADKTLVSLIHPRACIENDVHIGEHVMIWAHVYINIWCSIGNNTIINNGATIEHDNAIWQHSHIAPWVTTAGTVRVWEVCMIWLWTCVKEWISICSNVLIWSASNVVKPIDTPWIYYWNPAKFKKESMG